MWESVTFKLYSKQVNFNLCVWKTLSDFDVSSSWPLVKIWALNSFVWAFRGCSVKCDILNIGRKIASARIDKQKFVNYALSQCGVIMLSSRPFAGDEWCNFAAGVCCGVRRPVPDVWRLPPCGSQGLLEGRSSGSAEGGCLRSLALKSSPAWWEVYDYSAQRLKILFWSRFFFFFNINLM